MSRWKSALVFAGASIVAAVFGASTAMAGGGWGNETMNYTYDAKGRLVQVQHSGTVNTNVMSNYSFDKADNRVNANVSGAP